MEITMASWQGTEIAIMNAADLRALLMMSETTREYVAETIKTTPEALTIVMPDDWSSAAPDWHVRWTEDRMDMDGEVQSWIARLKEFISVMQNVAEVAEGG